MTKLKNTFLKRIALGAIIIALGFIISNLCGCSILHVHTYKTAYEYDETMHWQICEKCGQKLNVDVHAFNDFNNTCVFCGYHDSIVVVNDNGLMTGLTSHGKKKYEIDLPANVKFIAKDALKDSMVTKINIPKEFVGYHEGAFDYNNINITTEETKVTWTYEDGIYYKHNVLEEYEAVIDDQCFKTLNEAFESIHKDGTTVTIVKENLTIDEPIYVSSIIELKSYYETTNLVCDFQIAGSGILKIDSSIDFKGNAQLILVNCYEELDEDYQRVYKSGAIAFIDRETKPNDVYVEYVKSFTKTAGFGYEAIGSKQVVNDLLIIPVPQYSYGTFAFSTDFKYIMGLSPYGSTVSELHITNVVKNINVDIANYAFSVWTDIKINIAVIDDTHITYYQTKGSFSSLYIDNGVKSIGYRSFCNEMTDDIFHEVRITLSLLCQLKTLYIGDSVTFIQNNAFASALGLEEVYGGKGLTSIGENAFYECLNLTTVDFSEALKLGTINKYAFASCDNLRHLSLPRDNWTINGHTFVPHQFTPEVAAYHAVNVPDDCKRSWSRTVIGKICYTKSLSQDSCGQFNDAVYTNNIYLAIFNCCAGGWIYIMDYETKNLPITKITKNINIVAYNTAKDITIGTEENGLVVEKNTYITLDNIKPLGKVLINCDTTYREKTTGTDFYNSAAFGIRAEDHDIYRNTHVYFSDTANNIEVEARYTSTAFKEGIDYMVYGLFNFLHEKDTYIGDTHIVNRILFDEHNVLFNSITKVTMDNPIMTNDTYQVDDITISVDLFSEHKNIRYVSFADSITYIALAAFIDCTNLERINFGNGVKEVHEIAFSGCSKLKRVEFGSEDKLLCIENNAFAGCTALEYFDFNGNIGDWIIKVPDSDTVIATITADQLTDPYATADLIKQYYQYDWWRN